MSYSYYNLNNNFYTPQFKGEEYSNALLSKPINKVSEKIENLADTFVKPPEDEKNKKARKTAIAVGSSVLVLTSLIALLNPKYSSKWITKLRTKQGRLNRGTKSKLIGGTIKTLEYVNNFNSIKDIWFQKLCNKTSFTRKPHQTITKWFDSLAKHTVRGKYKKANEEMVAFERVIRQYKNKLSPQAQLELEAKLTEASNSRDFFSLKNVEQRFKNQEKVMSELESKTSNKINEYFSDMWKIIRGKKKGGKEYFKDNVTFWAQDIIQPQRKAIETQGESAVSRLIGNPTGQKGLYNEMLEMVVPKLNEDEKMLVETYFKKASKKLKKANYSECVEYFDKKRDLMLGSAPTDIVTALGLIALGGVSIASGHDKDERISRTITVAAPAVLGVGTSIALTAMLFSGVQGMVGGLAAGWLLNRLGISVDKSFIKHKNQEVVNA